MILVLRSRKLKGWADMDEFFGLKEDFDDTLVHGKQGLTLLLSGFNHVSCLPYLEKNNWQTIFSDGFGSYHVERFIIFHEWLLALWLMPIYTPSIWGGWDVSVWIFVVTIFSIIRQFLKQVNLLVQQGSCGGSFGLYVRSGRSTPIIYFHIIGDKLINPIVGVYIYPL